MSRLTYQQKRRQKFARLVRLHKLAVEQSQRADAAGHHDLATKTLASAREILRDIDAHVAEDQANALLKQRSATANKLHNAMAGRDRKRIRELTAELAGIDSQINAA